MRLRWRHPHVSVQQLEKGGANVTLQAKGDAVTVGTLGIGNANELANFIAGLRYAECVNEPLPLREESTGQWVLRMEWSELRALWAMSENADIATASDETLLRKVRELVSEREAHAEREALRREARQEALLDAGPILAEHNRLRGE